LRAWQGLNFTPEQLRQEFKAGGDILDLVSGAVTAKALRLTGKTLVLMYCPDPKLHDAFDPTANGSNTMTIICGMRYCI
jgi:hypothetical protein